MEPAEPGAGTEGPGPLTGLRVVECAQGIAGPYCGKMLADLGAEVLKVEPPASGDASRGWGPFPEDRPDRERSGLFHYLNAGKRGVTLEVEHPDGLALLHRLLEGRDILLHDLRPGRAEAAGLGYPDVHERHPSLIVTALTPYGWTGPDRDAPATELTVYNRSGMAHETPQHGVESLDLPPLRPGGDQASFLHGMVAGTATLSAVFARAVEGEGQFVDAAALEALTGVMLRITLHQSTYEGKQPDRRRATDRLMDYVPCADGYVNIPLQEVHWWHNLVKVMGDPEWAHDPLLQDANFRGGAWDVVQPLIEDWAKAYTRKELFEKLQAGHVPCLPGNTFADLLADPHLAARGYWVTPADGGLKGAVFPGAPYRFSRTPWRSGAAAPRLGEHNVAVFGGELGLSPEETARLRKSGAV